MVGLWDLFQFLLTSDLRKLRHFSLSSLMSSGRFRLAKGRTKNPSGLIQPSSSNLFQSDSLRPIGQVSGGGKMVKKRQNSAMERPMFCLLCRQVLHPNSVMVMTAIFGYVSQARGEYWPHILKTQNGQGVICVHTEWVYGHHHVSPRCSCGLILWPFFIFKVCGQYSRGPIFAAGL